MHFAYKTLLKKLLLASLAAGGFAGAGFAQGGPEGQAMQLTVRPSGYEAERSEAQERQQKLLARLEKSDHTFRSICVNCGDSWSHQIYAPFNPLTSLGPSNRTSEESAKLGRTSTQ